MPTYEYACKACGERLEVVHSFSDAPWTECPACAGPLRKVFSPVGISFKGSGFYKTDSRSGAKSPSASAPASTPSSDSGSGSESKASETKPSESASKSSSDAGAKPSSSPSAPSSAAAS